MAGIQSSSVISYQYIGDHIIKQLIKLKYPLNRGEAGSTGTDLSHEECNAVQYTAGYVVMKLKKKMKKNTPHKADLLLCLGHLEKSNNDDDATFECSEEWINLIDLGVYVMLAMNTYELLLALEK